MYTINIKPTERRKEKKHKNLMPNSQIKQMAATINAEAHSYCVSMLWNLILWA